MNLTLSGINVQFPISQLILSGEKTVETRGYPLPGHYLGVDLALIETPGPEGDFESRIVGIVTFSGCFEYRNADEFYRDFARHRVSEDSPWKWRRERRKFGWVIKSVVGFRQPQPGPARKGIVYTKNVSVRRERHVDERPT